MIAMSSGIDISLSVNARKVMERSGEAAHVYREKREKHG